MFRRLFIANRGEVAVRIARACDALGIEAVFGVSEADQNAHYVRGKQQVCLGPARSSLSYLDPVRVVQAARQSGCSAVHPGWGFLSENPLFSALCEAHGLTFVGPPPAVMQRMGTKTPAKQAMRGAGLEVIPGSEGVLMSLAEATHVAKDVGFPVLIKAESGGGGRGMRIARTPAQLPAAFADAQREALAAFGDPRVYLERLIEGGRHIEIQLMADRYGHVVHLGERDCSVQRNHQKLIEESPSPVLGEDERQRTLRAATAAAASIGYVGAGTMEFLLDNDGTLRFMEMNTRLQVEHSVTEMRTGLDLVEEQLRVAAGHRLRWTQDQVSLDGHVIECRINAEDPQQDFCPGPGLIRRWEPPEGTGIRVDTHVVTGYEVPPHYDSLLAKIIVRGEDRQAATARMLDALERFHVEGVPTTIAMHQVILSSEEFREHRYTTAKIPGWPPAVASLPSENA